MGTCWDLPRSCVDHASELNTSGIRREHLFPESHSLLLRGYPWAANPLALPVCPYRNTGWIPTSFPGNRVRKLHGRKLNVCDVTEGRSTSTKLGGQEAMRKTTHLSTSISAIGLFLIFTFKNRLDFTLSIVYVYS